jgi:hypothetical protein
MDLFCNLLITEFHGPLTIADPGKPPTIAPRYTEGNSAGVRKTVVGFG